MGSGGNGGWDVDSGRSCSRNGEGNFSVWELGIDKF